MSKVGRAGWARNQVRNRWRIECSAKLMHVLYSATCSPSEQGDMRCKQTASKQRFPLTNVGHLLALLIQHHRRRHHLHGSRGQPELPGSTNVRAAAAARQRGGTAGWPTLAGTYSAAAGHVSSACTAGMLTCAGSTPTATEQPSAHASSPLHTSRQARQRTPPLRRPGALAARHPPAGDTGDVH